MKFRLFIMLALVAQLVGVLAVPVLAQESCEEGFRAVLDANEVEVCIPEAPERIVALMEPDLDALLALGVTPLGTTNGRGQSTPPRYLGDALEGIEVVGDFYSPNLELVLELQPDLILMGGFDDEAVLAQLNEIAPVVNTFQNGAPWQDHLTRVGEILNLQAEAAEFITKYDARVEEITANLGDNTEAGFIVARWSPDGPQIMAPHIFSSVILADLGLTPPAELPDYQEGHPHTAPLSLESLSLLDTDWAFVGTLSDSGDAVDALNETLEDPLFQALEVVQNGHVVVVDGSLWTSVGGPLAALEVLNVVEAALTDVSAEADATPAATEEAN